MFKQTLNIFNNRSLGTINFNLPQMGSTLTGWEVSLTLIKITQSIVDGDRVEKRTPINFLGCWQPLRDEQLQFKPEGLRSWAWYWIHAKAGTLNLKTQDKIIFNNVQYKVMSVKDYSLNGFIEYEVIEDYQEE